MSNDQKYFNENVSLIPGDWPNYTARSDFVDTSCSHTEGNVKTVGVYKRISFVSTRIVLPSIKQRKPTSYCALLNPGPNQHYEDWHELYMSSPSAYDHHRHMSAKWSIVGNMCWRAHAAYKTTNVIFFQNTIHHRKISKVSKSLPLCS